MTLLVAEDESPHSRDRGYPLGLSLQCFLWKILQFNTSCREVLRQVHTLYRLAGQGTVDEDNSASFQVRQRLPLERMTGRLSATASAADRRSGIGDSLQGRSVKVADGSSVQALDTAANRKRFPQPIGRDARNRSPSNDNSNALHFSPNPATATARSAIGQVPQRKKAQFARS